MIHNTVTCPKCNEKIELSDAIIAQLTSEEQAKWQNEKQEAIVAAKKEQAKQSEQDMARELEKQRLQDQQHHQAEINKYKEFEIKALKAENKIQEIKANKESEKQKAINEATERERQKFIQSNKESDTKHRLELAERDKTVEQLKKQIETMQETANKTSQELQGEVWELDVEKILNQRFPKDTITEVKRGVRGADALQTVLDEDTFRPAGKIIWEMKNTKNFSQGWIAKLKDNQRAENADIAVLATVAMPNKIDTFGLMEGVWVCSPAYLYPLTVALRRQLIEINRVKTNQQGRDDKIAIMYDYLNSDQFRNRLDTIVTKIATMRDHLNGEQRATKLRWGKQEQNIAMMEEAITGMAGEMMAIAGNTIPTIDQATQALDYDDNDDGV